MMYRVGSPEETRALAARLAKTLNAGDIVLLSGPLGAGKTEFTRGLAEGLACDEPVSSPTFALMHLYHGGRLPLAHLDLYRLESVDLYELGADDISGESVLAIEWPERLARSEPEAIDVRIAIEEDGARTISLSRDIPKAGASPC